MATFLTYKSFDCSNGLFKANVYIEGEKSGKSGFVFRYNAMDDHYILIFDFPGKDGSF
jgi:hypothetical protein